MPPGVEQPAVDGFLKTVLRSGLLTREQLQSELRGVPREQRSDPKVLADHLIRKGKLTRFQARKLLEGTALGLVLGCFQILAPIGRGGMGTVYLARDSRSQELLALKILAPRRAREEPRILARFRREMEMCRRVAHPHLAWTCDVGVCQGVHYIAMEYIPGKSLHRLVSEQGVMEFPRVARLFSEVASAIDHAHHQSLIHRDLKPSNILITPHDHAKVLDLGLALVLGEGPVAREVIGGVGYIVGTMDYIAPEQSEDASKADARSDIYSLGCSIYYTLTGQTPFPGGTGKEKIHRHRTEAPVSIAQLNPKVPPRFVELIEKMMSKKPEDRFPTAAAVLEALESWISGTPVLPLDKPDDEAYQEAVAVLEAEAVSSELLEAEEEVADLPLAEVISDANLVVIDDSSASLLLPPLPPSLPLVEDKMSFPWPLLVSLGGLLIVFAGLLVWYIVLTR